VTKLFLSVVLVGCAARAQGWGHREAMLPWVQGRFADAEANFSRMRPIAESMRDVFWVWEADFETERGRYGVAALLLQHAKAARESGSELPERRLGRLYVTVGRYGEAEKLALNGSKWDGTDVKKLKINAPMSLVTLGEVFLARGQYTGSLPIFEDACARAKKDWSLQSLEWVRARNDVAIANLRMGQTASARASIEQAFATASREWGPDSLPAIDALDILGLVLVAESKFQEADDALSRTRGLRERIYGVEHPKVADSYLHAAILAAAQHDNDAAIRFLNRSLQIQATASVGRPNGRWALALISAADIFTTAGHLDDARRCYLQGLPELEHDLGSDAPIVQRANKQFQSLPGNGGS